MLQAMHVRSRSCAASSSASTAAVMAALLSSIYCDVSKWTVNVASSTYLSHGNRVCHSSLHARDDSFGPGCTDNWWHLIIAIVGRRHDARALVGASGVL